jgi:hypothetical protein
MSEKFVDLVQIVPMSDLSVPDSFKAGQDARAALRLDELAHAEGDVVVRAPSEVT